MSSDAGGPAEFANAAEHTVTLTVVVAGGVRRSTARRRAERVAEKLAGAASRTKHVLDATARAGPSHLGEVHFSLPAVQHRRARLVLLPGDPEELRCFAAREWQVNPDLPDPLTRDAGHELERPDDL